VIEEWGNHGRIGRSARGPVVRQLRPDDLRARPRDARRRGPPDLGGHRTDIQRVEIGNYRALLIHGDEIGRNGYASSRDDRRARRQVAVGRLPVGFRDSTPGHRHNHGEWRCPTAWARFYQTGSTESDNRYAHRHGRERGPMSQRLHFWRRQLRAVGRTPGSASRANRTDGRGDREAAVTASSTGDRPGRDGVLAVGASACSLALLRHPGFSTLAVGHGLAEPSRALRAATRGVPYFPGCRFRNGLDA
jgi:hypothetical protein